ncbi:hypothetical protein MGA3_07180 [Bacillus methanolicus MGA3]|nr:hypothetical protein MGA3_07180 [Bacillus methanolicus MGA3]
MEVFAKYLAVSITPTTATELRKFLRGLLINSQIWNRKSSGTNPRLPITAHTSLCLPQQRII